ncbi:hypothetical protein BGAL_0448g00110 [Botrytis galanthina]|uniref:Aminoglycoside phosphotransferase domain-containing protein n=1 Tax=Botrytis galanthina TaxID=278940 RepID=A0A4V4HTP0_9HELO|nr:hypothetical protein BGAL_0448g00110 [Botrytis galanthina]
MEEEKVQKLPPRVVQHMQEFDTTYHPGVDPKDLVHMVHDTIIGGLDIEEFENSPPARGKVLCYNCGLTDSKASSGYSSRVKISHLKHNNAMWELGGPDGPWILRDEINVAKSSWSVDYAVQKFLRDANLGLPLVEMYRFGGGDGRFNYTMMSRAKGKSLMDLSENLCDEQNGDLEMDLIKQVKIIRQFTSPHMQRVDGGELLDNHIGNCYGFPCVKTGRNEEEWLENLTPAMRKGLLWTAWRRNKAGLHDPAIRDSWVKNADEHIVEIKAGFPRGGPYVLTHGDLNYSNLFGSNDNADQKWKVTAIIDWESAGYFPWWVEIVRCPILLSGPGTKEENILGFCPPTFNTKDWEPMMKAIKSVADLWKSGGIVGRSRHGEGGGANSWYGKDFCECHKIKRRFMERHIWGWPQEHYDAFDPELSYPDDDPESENYIYKYDFEKDEREFLRWFKTIST